MAHHQTGCRIDLQHRPAVRAGNLENMFLRFGHFFLWKNCMRLWRRLPRGKESLLSLFRACGRILVDRKTHFFSWLIALAE
jgi:hypothetical protein